MSLTLFLKEVLFILEPVLSTFLVLYLGQFITPIILAFKGSN